MTYILSSILTILAKSYIWRFRPRIIAITGNSGKTTTKEAIAIVLSKKYRVRSAAGNLNNELGVPLTILGDFSDEYYRTGGTALFWLKVILKAKIRFFMPRDQYPEILILEYGADHPGDIKKLAKRFSPGVAIITQVGEVPVHVEFFASARDLANEKMQLIKHLAPTDRAVLNYDDLTVLEMREHTKARVSTFGFGQGADVQVGTVAVRPEVGRPEGIRFDVTTRNSSMPLVVNGTLGRGVASACAAAVTVATIFGIGLADTVESLTRFRAPAGRMRILRGIKDTTIIDDTYNASPAAVHLAMDTVKQLSGRKVLVLGDMLELGQHSTAAHQAVGDMAGEIAQELVCVGERARFIADSAGNQMSKDRVHWFADATAAASKVQELLRPGDVVLVKGSQGMRLERIVKEIMAEPDRASELLVRQSTRWLQK